MILGCLGYGLALALVNTLGRGFIVKGKRVLIKTLFFCSSLGLVASMAGFAFAHFWYNPSARAWFEFDYWKQWLRFGETLRLSHAQYHDLNKSKFENLTDNAVMGMVQSLDRHSSYYSPNQYKIFQEDSHRQYFGIGIMIRKIEQGVLISKVFPEGPASSAGLLVGDFILSVNDESIEGLELADISSKIKGMEGTSVEIKISRREDKKRINVKRGQIQISTVDRYYVDENKTGYLHLIQFSTRSREEVSKALLDMQNLGMKNLILDLRDNSGGLLSSAIEVASFFLPKEQLVVELKGRELDKFRSFRTTSVSPRIKLPMVVLINEASASASEIVAGALSILGRAKTIGEKSYGKGSVQTVFKLSDQSGLRLTTAMYYLPDGSTIHEQGIDPEFHVECSDENETKLRIQRNLNQQVLEEYNFNELFGFNPIQDLQLREAKRVLMENP
jgi:carboxyl-terminal processing protease